MRLRACLVAVTLVVGTAGGASAVRGPGVPRSNQQVAPTVSVSEASTIVQAMSRPSTAWLSRFLGPGSPKMSRDISQHLVAGVSAQEDLDFRYADVWPVDDYDHDGRVDFVSYDAHESGTFESPFGEYVIRTVNGRTGKVMSTLQRSGRGLFIELVSMPVGASARRGLMLIEYQMLTDTFRLSAHDGRGHTLWSVAPAPTIDGQSAQLSLDGFVSNRGHASDVLVHWVLAPVETGAGMDGVAETYGVQLTQIGVVSGVNGALQARGAQITSVNFTPKVFSAPDLDGDGHGDTAIATGAPRHSGSIEVHSALSGTRLWQSGAIDIPFFFQAWWVDSTLGNTRPDLMPWAWEIPRGDPRLAPVTGGPDGQATVCNVVDGATGSTGYTFNHRGMGFCFPVGDADGDHRQDVVVDSLDHTATSATYTMTLVSPEHKRSIWGKVAKINADFSDSSSISTSTSVLGDLQGDGVWELAYVFTVSTSADHKMQRKSDSFDGRSGHDLQLASDLSPMFVSFDGAGDELLRVHVKQRTATVTLVEGRTRRAIGTYTFPLVSASDGFGFYDMAVVRGCVRELVVVDYRVDRASVLARSVTVIDSATGRAKLRIAPNGARPAPLTVRRSGPRQHCSH
jgi:hypothetical protein